MTLRVADGAPSPGGSLAGKRLLIVGTSADIGRGVALRAIKSRAQTVVVGRRGVLLPSCSMRQAGVAP